MSFIQNSTNSRRLSNELQQIGNSSPPNMANVSEKVLSAASPKGFNLVNTKTDLTSSDAESKRCREFTDITGLRNLQKEQINRTHYDAGCGWRYRPSNGIFPEINQGAAGTANGPLALYSGPGGKDEVVGGTRWYWNLKDAERDITTKICQSASKCNQLSMLGRYAEICGYCKTSGAVIPVQNIGGTFSARYNDATLGCTTSNIVTATTGKCDEGFTGQMPFDAFGSAGGSLRYNVSDPVRNGIRSEGFLDLDALNQCMDPPLSRDCIILAARTAGCADEGSLITALKGSAPNSDYDSLLKKNSVYAAYNSVAVPGITGAILKDGTVSMAAALDDFGRLMLNTQNNNQKLALSARDLCIRSGEYDSYDFCSELAPTTIIDNTTLPCIQQAWLNNGGTKEGKMYPGDSWKGKSYQSFLTSMSQIKQQTKSRLKSVNVKAILDFFGANSQVPQQPQPQSQPQAQPQSQPQAQPQPQPQPQPQQAIIPKGLSDKWTDSVRLGGNNPFPGGWGYRIAWNGSYWIAVGSGQGSSAAKSVDGITWTPSHPLPGSGGAGIAWNGSYWIAVGSGQGGSSAAKSVDGIRWTPSHPFPGGGYGIAWNGSYWIAVSQDVSQGGSSAAKSVDGITWTQSNPFPGGVGYGIAWNGSYWIAVGHQFRSGGSSAAKSVDGITWTPSDPLPGSGGTAIAWNGSYWIAVGGSSAAKSVDGITWTQSKPFPGGVGTGIAWNGSYWIAVGRGQGGSSAAKSVDGITWTQSNPFTGGAGTGIAWNGSYWIAVGAGVSSSDVLYSISLSKG